MNLNFMLFWGPWACTEDCVRYLYARKHNFVHDWGMCVCIEGYIVWACLDSQVCAQILSCACVEVCIVYVVLWKVQFMLCRGPYACGEDSVMYVHAMKCNFVHDQGPCACAGYVP